MKRDMELCRNILLEIESSQSEKIYGFHIKDYSDEMVRYHCNLLREHGLITKSSEDILGELIVGNLTWEGQDFVEKIHDDTIWNRTKETIINKGLTMGFDIVKQVSSEIIASMAKGAVEAILEKGAFL